MHGRGLGAACNAVIDGDTLDLTYSLEFGIIRRATARLIGLDTAEIFGRLPGTPERVAGERQAAFVQQWLAASATTPRRPWPLLVEYHGPDKFGRDLVTVRDGATGASLNAAIVEAFPETAGGTKAKEGA